jgi:hypothetical protein
LCDCTWLCFRLAGLFFRLSLYIYNMIHVLPYVPAGCRTAPEKVCLYPCGGRHNASLTTRHILPESLTHWISVRYHESIIRQVLMVVRCARSWRLGRRDGAKVENLGLAEIPLPHKKNSNLNLRFQKKSMTFAPSPYDYFAIG